MKKCGWVVLCVLAASVACANTAFAGGWGPFFSWARETPKAGFPGLVQDLVLEAMRDQGATQPQLDAAQSAMNSTNLDVKLDHLAFGVLYDSAPSRDKLFNYRMSLGFDLATNISVDNANVAIPGFGNVALPLDVSLDRNSSYGLTFRNTFGFGIIRTERLKWWAGPTLDLNFDYWKANPVEAAALSIGGGAETGVNIHIASKYSICLGGGVLWNAFGYGASENQVGSIVWGNGPFYFIQVAGLYHTGEDQTAWQQAAAAPMR